MLTTEEGFTALVLWSAWHIRFLNWQEEPPTNPISHTHIRETQEYLVTETPHSSNTNREYSQYKSLNSDWTESELDFISRNEDNLVLNNPRFKRSADSFSHRRGLREVPPAKLRWKTKKKDLRVEASTLNELPNINTHNNPSHIRSRNNNLKSKIQLTNKTDSKFGHVNANDEFLLTGSYLEEPIHRTPHTLKKQNLDSKPISPSTMGNFGRASSSVDQLIKKFIPISRVGEVKESNTVTGVTSASDMDTAQIKKISSSSLHVIGEEKEADSSPSSWNAAFKEVDEDSHSRGGNRDRGSSFGVSSGHKESILDTAASRPAGLVRTSSSPSAFIIARRVMVKTLSPVNTHGHLVYDQHYHTKYSQWFLEEVT